MGALALKKFTLAAAVANAATVTTAYPTGFVQADLLGTTGGVLTVANDVWKQGASGFTVVFGASDITITNTSGVTWAAGAEVVVSFGRVDINGSYNLTFPKKTQDKVNSLA
jgi:hypothetical protein